MNEETEVKAPVTRLRRRLSVEQSEDGKSSPALGTPTKKRGGRKAAKPELDLIDENAAENSLKTTTKKNIVKDVAESESEKPITPSRRSARIKSNTSIVSDTVQNVDSPRAKRAARRTSQVGSDTEMSLTPARTRRTRKDSTSSIEKQAVVTPTLTKAQIPEIITEEPDNTTKLTTDGLKTSDNESTTQTPIRKSPRIVTKKSRNSNSSTQDEGKNNSVESNNESINSNKSNKNDAVESDIRAETNIIKDEDNTNSYKNRLSVSSCNLIRDLEDKPKKNNSKINKSLTEAQDINKIKSKRHRTKSWTTITNVSSINEDFYSDNEIIKKKHQQKFGDEIKIKPFNTGSGDSKHNRDSNDEELNCSQNKILSSGKKKKKETKLEKSIKESEVTNLFQRDPSENIQTTIVMEDSDSNPLQENLSKNNINEDQCVPVVDHQLESKDNESPEFPLTTSFKKNKNESIVSKVKNTNNTCEPMDVDETLPECLPNVSTKEPENQEISSLHNTLETNSSLLNKTSNRSKRKSFLSTSQNLEKSNTENKSTLVLSQLKDVSNTENKSPKFSKKEQLSESTNILNITHENEKRKKSSLNYLTSTPLQQKADLGETCKNKSNNIFDNNVSKNKDNVTSKKNVSEIANRSEHNSKAESESDEELETSKTSNLLDNEAEEASDDYESGDSQDEDEKQYEKDNEIVEKGETLTSDDEISNDSDYEKDSFVVTSDEEDNELLSGSGDDLSMSDNELKMDPKSKKKYNARKIKEQKQASREMYESRHKLNTSKKDRSLKSSKIKENSRERLDSSNSDKSEDIIKCTKKNKRMRLDSTATDSINISKIENTDSRKKEMDSSESSEDENILKEKEITITEEAMDDIDNPLALHIKEENTSMKQENMSIDFVDTDVQKNNPSDTLNSKSLESKNPLEDSDNESSSSLSTEDENIAQNYNDMLKDLKVKTANHSLTIEKKSKKKSSTPIVDHLNITQTKALKSRNKSSQKENTTINSNEQNERSTENWSVTNYINQSEDPDQNSNENEDASISHNKNFKFGDCSLNLENKSKEQSKPPLVDQLNLTQGSKKSKKEKSEKRKSNNLNTNENINNDDSSDSIDLKLLFSEDSINSSDFNKESVKKAGNNTDNFIPLKKVEAKTDIRASKDLVDNGNTDPPFFVDTIGNQLSDLEEEIINKRRSLNKTQREEESSNEDSNDEPLEVSYKKEKNEKFVKENKEENIDVDETDHGTKPLTDKSLLKTPQSEKKRKKLHMLSKNLSQIENICDNSLIKHNKKNNTSASFNVSNLDVLFSVENMMESKNNKSINNTPGSEKKKLKKLSQSNDSDLELNNTEVKLNKSIGKTPKSEKKKKKLSESQNLETLNLVDKISDASLIKQNNVSESNLKTPNSEKKKKQLSLSENSETFSIIDKTSDELFNKQNIVSKSTVNTPGSEKKMKKLSQLNSSDLELNNTEVTLNKSIGKTPNSEKRKKKLSESKTSETFNVVDKISDQSINEQNYVNKSYAKNPNSEKKKTKLSSSENSERLNLNDIISDESINKQNYNSKKKRLSQLNLETDVETNQNNTNEITDSTQASDGDITNSNKRKRSSSVHLHDIVLEENEMMVGKTKKRKISQKSEENDTQDLSNSENNTEINIDKTINSDIQPNMSQKSVKNKKSKESYDTTTKDVENNTDTIPINTKGVLKGRKHKDDIETVNLKPNIVKNKKRKNREDDNDANEALKIRKENSFDEIHISRLPPSILNKLEDKPNKVKVASKKRKVISTTDFAVEETRKRRNKPSNYLEESIYINDDESMEEQKKKNIIKKPKVLPFVPTVTTSNSGYTTNFKVNVIPQEIKFVAQSNNVNSFKNEYLYGKKIKRLGTYDLYKRNRNIKMSKF